MKIGIIQNNVISASEIFVYTQALELKRAGHEVRLFGYRNKDQSRELTQWYATNVDIPIYNPWRVAPYPWARNLCVAIQAYLAGRQQASKLALTLDSQTFGWWAESRHLHYWGYLFSQHQDLDLIYAHFAPVGGIVAMLKEAGIIETPLITALHGADVTSDESKAHIKSGLYQMLWKHCTAYTYVSEEIRKSALNIGFPAKPMEWIPMGVDVKHFDHVTHVHANDTIRIITVARLVEKKGLTDSIQSLRLVKDKGYKFLYTIIGEGAMRAELEFLIHKLGMTNEIRLLGSRAPEFVRAELAISDIFLLASKTSRNGNKEGLPVVILEAQASGLPVVSTRHSGIPQAVVDGESAILVNEGDILGLADSIIKLIEDPALRKQMGCMGRSHVYSNFATKTLALKLLHWLKTWSPNHP